MNIVINLRISENYALGDIEKIKKIWKSYYIVRSTIMVFVLVTPGIARISSIV